MSTPTTIEQALAWLIDNSDGVVGLRLDGEMMPWSEVISGYLPWWGTGGVDRELYQQTYPDCMGLRPDPYIEHHCRCWMEWEKPCCRCGFDGETEGTCEASATGRTAR